MSCSFKKQIALTATTLFLLAAPEPEVYDLQDVRADKFLTVDEATLPCFQENSCSEYTVLSQYVPQD